MASNGSAAPFVIRVYDDAGNVIETHEHTGDPKESFPEEGLRAF
jgi:hypothetical protein